MAASFYLFDHTEALFVKAVPSKLAV